MIFDDHDVIDDWNTSRDWVARDARQGWWDERIVGGLHVLLVLPAPRQPLARGPRRGRAATARSAPPTATPAPIVRDFAFRADREVAGARWSYKRDIGRTRIVMMDSRAGPRARRRARARWSTPRSGTASRSGRAATSTTCCSGTSLPVFLGRGMHYLEAWNEAVCDGAWGALASARGRAPAPGPRPRALGRLRRLAARASSGLLERRSPPGATAAPPGTVVLLSGDVHHAYVADARPADGQPAWQAPVYQAVCSPLRNPLDSQRAARDQARR